MLARSAAILLVGLLPSLAFCLEDDAASKEPRKLLTIKESAGIITFSPDGKWVATASDDHTAKVWDAMTGKEVATISHDGIVSCVAFSPDAARLATASHDKTIRFWDVRSITRD